MQLLLILILLLNTYVKPAFAAVKINELYPAPQTGTDEWVELFNDGTDAVSTENLILKDASGKNIHIPQTTIPEGGYISATSSGVLNNSGGDTVNLTDTDGSILDTISYNQSFIADYSYARCQGEWVKTTTVTKNQDNAPACFLPSISPTETPTPTQSMSPTPTQPEITQTTTPTQTQTPTKTPTPTPTTPVVTFDHVYISEFMPNPEAGGYEWVELFNDNSFDVVLSDWYIDDIENGGSGPKNFSTTITSHGYVLIPLSSAIFNNAGDSVRLLDATKSEIEAITYDQSIQGQSWGKNEIGGASVCLMIPSPGSPNNPCLAGSGETEQITQTPTPTPNVEPIISPSVVIPTLKPAHANASVERPRPNNIPDWYYHELKRPNKTSRSAAVLGSTDKMRKKNNRNDTHPFLPLTGATSSFLTILSLAHKIKRTFP